MKINQSLVLYSFLFAIFLGFNLPGFSQQNKVDSLWYRFNGEGTGLGLSLSYDIVKAHGGELKVETKENEGAEFIINIPNN